MVVICILLLLMSAADSFAERAFTVRDTAMVFRYGQTYTKFARPLSFQDFFTVRNARDNRILDIETKMLFHVMKPLGTLTDVKLDSLPIIPFVPSCGNDGVVFYLEASIAMDAYEIQTEDFYTYTFFRSQPYTTVDEPNPHFFRMFSSLTRLQHNGDDSLVIFLNTLQDNWPYFILRFVVDNGSGMAVWDWPEQGIAHFIKGHMEGDSLDDLLDRGDWRIRLATQEEMVSYTGAYAKFRWQREIGALDPLKMDISGPNGQAIVSCYLTMPFQSMLETGGANYITFADEFLEEHPAVMLQFPNEEVAEWLGLSGDSLVAHCSR